MNRRLFLKGVAAVALVAGPSAVPTVTTAYLHRPPTKPWYHPLTPRRAQVAELVTQGMTDREIAKQLVISTTTARHQVYMILRELGLSRRVEIAVWVARHDPRLLAWSRV